MCGTCVTNFIWKNFRSKWKRKQGSPIGKANVGGSPSKARKPKEAQGRHGKEGRARQGKRKQMGLSIILLEYR